MGDGDADVGDGDGVGAGGGDDRPWLASASSWARVPLNLFMSTWPRMPRTLLQALYCQNVQCVHAPPKRVGREQ